MHDKVKKIVGRVWEGRMSILTDPDETLAKDDTIEDRVYRWYYAGSDPLGKEGTAEADYQASLIKLDAAARAYGFTVDSSQEGAFRRYQSDHSPGLGDMRIYLNVKPKWAAAVCVRVLTRSGARKALSHELSDKRVIQPPKGPPLVVGPFGGMVDMFKVAEGDNAFDTRRDKIVIYLKADFPKATEVATELQRSCQTDWFEKGTPSMTFKVARGISVGVEVHGKQWDGGRSFGEVRSYLIAKALFEVMTNKTVDERVRRHEGKDDIRYPYEVEEDDYDNYDETTQRYAQRTVTKYEKKYDWVGNEEKQQARYLTDFEGRWKVMEQIVPGGTRAKARFYKMKAPIGQKRTLRLNMEATLEAFEDAVVRYFKQSGVNPDEPWT